MLFKEKPQINILRLPVKIGILTMSEQVRLFYGQYFITVFFLSHYFQTYTTN